VELARHLVDWCDILIENMRPGVMARIGLGHERLAETNPDLIQLSTCNMGQTGPRAQTPGFGSQLSAMAGFCGLAGQPDGPPMLLYGPYIDFIAAFYGASAALAALERRRVSGEGARLDVSQYECGVSFLAGELLDFHATGTVATRRGNADESASPHGAYPCVDGQWLVLSCWTDAEFARLAAVLDWPERADDARFATVVARQANAGILDAAITAWCGTRAADASAMTLQSSEIHAYAVNTVADLFTDPQLTHRETWRVRRHPVIGDQAYYFPGFDLLDTPGDVMSAAPLLGGDNEHVYRDCLGLTEAELDRYRESGVIG
jgi:crotonobetainyl-CoA:carnitine CoA-transferase CaiB-like acyl-CoA transferase